MRFITPLSASEKNLLKLNQRDELTQKRLSALNSLHDGTKQKHLMLIVGEMKEITSARFAYKMIIKHLPDFPVMMNEDMYHRLCNRFSVEIEL